MENLGPRRPSGSESDPSSIHGMSWYIWESSTDNPNGWTVNSESKLGSRK